MNDPHRFDDLFSEFGPIRLRRFFGGEGIYAGAVMIGMVFNDIIYFKTDEQSRKRFAAEKCKPFQFTKKTSGEVVVTTWFAPPDRLYDDADEFAAWARAAHAVAARSLIAKKRRPALKKKARHPAGKRRA